ncbi:MAG: hypothetical protein R3Y19_04625 [Rikenellaceae bacterium]
MKTKIFTILAILSIVLFSSCSKDEELSISKTELVGTWDVVNVDDADIAQGYVYVVINDDNTYTQKWFSSTYSGTYELSGYTLIGKIGTVTERYVFTYLSGDDATISYSNDTGDSYVFKAEKR